MFGTTFVEYYENHVRNEVTPVWLKSWFEREREATLLRYFELAVVPALLQTEAYARALIEASSSGPAAADAIATRISRREILTRDEKPVRLTAILDESALYRHIGGAEVMREQLLALVEVTRHDNVSVYVVPAEAGSYIGLDGSFALATTHGRVMGFVDGPLNKDAIEDVDRVDDLERRWELIRRYTPTQERSIELIMKAADTWAT